MKTDTFVLTSTPRECKALRECSEVTFGEDKSVAGFPTVDFKHRKPTSTDDPIYHVSGELYIIKHPTGKFAEGDFLCYLETASGSSTFFQDENP